MNDLKNGILPDYWDIRGAFTIRNPLMTNYIVFYENNFIGRYGNGPDTVIAEI